MNTSREKAATEPTCSVLTVCNGVHMAAQTAKLDHRQLLDITNSQRQAINVVCRFRGMGSPSGA